MKYAQTLLQRNKKLKKIRVFVVRHGDYVDTLAKGMAGHLNPGLSEAGQQQANDLALALADTEENPLELVVCSPLRRAALTAELIAYQHAVTPQIDTDLVAIHRGDWSGLTLKEVVFGRVCAGFVRDLC